MDTYTNVLLVDKMNQLIWIILLTEMKLAFLVSGQLSGSLRITSGYAANAGRLEIFHNGEWGTVCDNHFDNIDARVACKQLGYWFVKRSKKNHKGLVYMICFYNLYQFHEKRIRVKFSKIDI